jgi:Predicted membrane protein (DUF2207)
VLKLDDINIPIDALTFPQFQESFAATIGSFVFIGLALVLIALALNRRFRARNAKRGPGSAVAQYEPPSGLNVMVAAHLLDRPRTAIPAQLLQLAVRKNLRILDNGLRRGRTGYSMQFLTLDRADPIEQNLLVGIFGVNAMPGAVRELKAGDRQLVRAITRASAAALNEAGRTGLRGLSSGYQWVNLLLAVLDEISLLTMCLILLFLFQYSWWVIVALVVTTAAIVISARSIRFIGTLTPKGMAIRDQLIGLKLYLQLAEKDRIRTLQAVSGAERVEGAGSTTMIALYEELLPFAVIWGIEDSWIKELIGRAVQLDTLPEWLSDPNALSALDIFSRSTNSWSDMATAMAPVGRQRITTVKVTGNTIY